MKIKIFLLSLFAAVTAMSGSIPDEYRADITVVTFTPYYGDGKETVALNENVSLEIPKMQVSYSTEKIYKYLEDGGLLLGELTLETSITNAMADRAFSLGFVTAKKALVLSNWKRLQTMYYEAAKEQDEELLTQYTADKAAEAASKKASEISATYSSLVDDIKEVNKSYKAEIAAQKSVDSKLENLEANCKTDIATLEASLNNSVKSLNTTNAQELAAIQTTNALYATQIAALQIAVDSLKSSGGTSVNNFNLFNMFVAASVDAVNTNNARRLSKWLGYQQEDEADNPYKFQFPQRVRGGGLTDKYDPDAGSTIDNYLSDKGVVVYADRYLKNDETNRVPQYTRMFYETISVEDGEEKTNVVATFSKPINWEGGAEPDNKTLEIFRETNLNPTTNLAIKGFYDTASRVNTGDLEYSDVAQNNEDESGACKYDILVRKTDDGAESGDTNKFHLAYVKPGGTYENVLKSLKAWADETRGTIPEIQDDVAVLEGGVSNLWNALNGKNPRNQNYQTDKLQNPFWRLYVRGDSDVADDIDDEAVKLNTIERPQSEIYGNALTLYGLWNHRTSDGKYLRPYVEKDDYENPTEMTLCWEPDYKPDATVADEKEYHQYKTIDTINDSATDGFSQISLYGFAGASVGSVPVKKNTGNGVYELEWKSIGGAATKIIGTDSSYKIIGAPAAVTNTLTFASESDSNVTVKLSGTDEAATITIGVYYK